MTALSPAITGSGSNGEPPMTISTAHVWVGDGEVVDAPLLNRGRGQLRTSGHGAIDRQSTEYTILLKLENVEDMEVAESCGVNNVSLGENECDVTYSVIGQLIESGLSFKILGGVTEVSSYWTETDDPLAAEPHPRLRARPAGSAYACPLRRSSWGGGRPRNRRPSGVL